MNTPPIRTKVYYVAKQPPHVRVYAVLISEHENEMFCGAVLHVLEELSDHGNHVDLGISRLGKFAVGLFVVNQKKK